MMQTEGRSIGGDGWWLIALLAVALLLGAAVWVLPRLRTRALFAAQGFTPVGWFVPFLGDNLAMVRFASTEQPLVIEDGKRCTRPPAVAQLWTKWRDEHGLFQLDVFGETRVAMTHPTHLKDVLMTKADVFEKPASMRTIFGGFLGYQSLLVSLTAEHAPDRRALGPAFEFEALRSMADGMRRDSEAAVREWLSGATADAPVDVHMLISALTLDVVGRAAFGGILETEEMSESAPALTMRGDAGRTLARELEWFLTDLMNDVYSLRFFIPFYRSAPFLPWNRERERRRAVMREIAATALRARAAARQAAPADAAPAKRDLLDLVLDAAATHAPAAREEWAESQSMTFISAGAETTAKLLTWALFCLSQHPEWKERMLAEVDASVREAEREEGADAVWPRYEHLSKLHVLEAVLQETLRVFSPVQVVPRCAARDVWVGKGTEELGDDAMPPPAAAADGAPAGKDGGPVFLPSGSTISILIGLVHRDPDRWPCPDVFDPARFLDDASIAPFKLRRLGKQEANDLAHAVDRTYCADPATFTSVAMPYAGRFPPPFDLIPFVRGPRSCIGSNFALLEARVLLAVFARRMQWSLNGAGYRHKPISAITLRPLDGMPMFISPRRAATTS